MTEKSEDEESSSLYALDAPVSKSPKRHSFKKMRRELNDEELANPAIQRLLYDEIERLEGECDGLKEMRDRFHVTDKRAAILEERLKKSLAGEIFSSAGLTVGAAAMGYAPSVWNDQPSGWIAIAFGLILVVGSVVAKVVKS